MDWRQIESLNVNGKVYKVEWCPLDEIGEVATGVAYVDFHTKTIKIWKDVHNEDVKEVILHEACHIIKGLIHTDDPEDFITELGNYLTDTLERNNLLT